MTSWLLYPLRLMVPFRWLIFTSRGYHQRIWSCPAAWECSVQNLSVTEGVQTSSEDRGPNVWVSYIHEVPGLSRTSKEDSIFCCSTFIVNLMLVWLLLRGWRTNLSFGYTERKGFRVLWRNNLNNPIKRFASSTSETPLSFPGPSPFYTTLFPTFILSYSIHDHPRPMGSPPALPAQSTSFDPQ
jgi:hypothetical protein